MSDKLDESYFNDHPCQRAVVHAFVHTAAAISLNVQNKNEEAAADWKRVGEQLSRAGRSNSPK
jgi:hypothetical protein